MHWAAYAHMQMHRCAATGELFNSINFALNKLAYHIRSSKNTILFRVYEFAGVEYWTGVLEGCGVPMRMHV